MEFLKGLLGFGKPKETQAVPAANMNASAVAPTLPNAPGAIPAANVAVGGRRRRPTRKNRKNSRKNKARK
jgi:hypothetical protein